MAIRKSTRSTALAELVQAIEFRAYKELHSPEYWAGAMARAKARVSRKRLQCPYKPGSTAFDAFMAGADSLKTTKKKEQPWTFEASVHLEKEILVDFT